MCCSRCGIERYPLTYIPTKTSIVTRKIKYGEWVCPICLTDEEAGGPKARLLRILWADLSEPHIPKTILREEYLYALEATAFRCPKGRRREDCDGHPCPRRPEDPTVDYYNECVRSLQARILVTEVMEGKVLLIKGIGGWEVELL